MPTLLVPTAAAGIYRRFRSKKVHDHTGRRSLKMAAVGTDERHGDAFAVAPPQISWKRERKSK